MLTNQFVNYGVPKFREEVGQESITLILQRAKHVAKLLQFFLYLSLAKRKRGKKIIQGPGTCRYTPQIIDGKYFILLNVLEKLACILYSGKL